jgi:NAD(P)H-dependent FMN reductase
MSHILIFSGTARKNNFTQHVSSFVASQLESKYNLTTEIVSPVSIGLTIESEGDKTAYPELSKKVEQADGYIIVSPEYNHSFPGSLKMMLDANDLSLFAKKPVGLVGVSSGNFAGVRMIESLIPVARYLGMVVLKNDLLVSNVQNEIVNDTFQDLEKWEKRLTKMAEELTWYLNLLEQK